MKNILRIFKKDVIRIHKNVIALIVIMGITIVPCLYAWFNIAGSWDPYSNTGNLKVAVASVDDGYEGTLIPIKLNVGNQVLSALRENTQMDWVFTSKKKAVDGVKSGKYYAAIVIPENFSNRMMSIFSKNVKKPNIIYYSNAKENAIAPKVTDKGASAIQKQVNQVFIETVSDTALTALQSVSNLAQAGDADDIVNNLWNNLDKIADDLEATQSTLETFGNMADASQSMLSTTTDFFKDTKSNTKSSEKEFNGIKKQFSGIKDTLTATTDAINSALSSGKKFYGEMSDVIEDALSSQSQNTTDVKTTLNKASSRVNSMISDYSKLKSSLESIERRHPELSKYTQSLISKIDASLETQAKLNDKLEEAEKNLKTGKNRLNKDKAEILKLVDKSKTSVSSVKTDYSKDVEDALKKISNSAGNVENDISGLLTKIDNRAKGIYKLSDSVDSDLSQIKKTLSDSGKLLSKAAKKIRKTTGKLKNAKDGDNSDLKSLIMGNKEDLTSFLATPVQLKTTKLYPIDNYGSSMAPFYSTLSIWIGGIVLVAMLKVNISEKMKKSLRNLQNYQAYFGRYIIFLIVGLMQSTLIALGDLYYLGIQCEHPFLFVFACWFSSIVYANIIYTLTVSFGDIGKAISVILLVVQVAGAGGTFPIEVAPGFFRAVYPLLPFTHSMAALREAVGGMYEMVYWIELGKLGIFLVISLFVGLVLQRPIIKMNDAFTEKLEETKIM